MPQKYKVDLSLPSRSRVKLAVLYAIKYPKKTIAEIARMYGIDRANLSKRVNIEKREIDDKDKNRSRDVKVQKLIEEAADIGSLGNRPNFHYDFLEFIDTYLGNTPCQECGGNVVHPTPDFHKEIIEAIEDPDNGQVLINVPPGFAKTTLMIWYTLYRIVKNPNTRVIIISRAQDLAVDILRQIKQYLTEYDWYSLTHQKRNLIEDWGPFFDKTKTSQLWSANQIIIPRPGAIKDPTITSLGLASQIYGKRADLVIMDDVVDSVTNSTAMSTEKILMNINRTIMSRAMGRNSKYVFVGTRVSPVDIYSQIKKWDGIKHINHPCIVEEADGEGVTLWNEHFTYEKACKIRKNFSNKDWDLIYQNLDVPDEGTSFTEEMLEGIKDEERGLGELSEHWHIIGGVDPASTGTTSITVIGVDKHTEKRYFIDSFAKQGMTADVAKNKMLEFTMLYRVIDWVVEMNSLQKMVFQDDTELRKRLSDLGALVIPHITTGKTKWDPVWGVEGLRPLFDQTLYSLPYKDRDGKNASDDVISELRVFPLDSANQDRVMSLWFCEIGAKRALKRSQNHNYNPPIDVPGFVARKRVKIDRRSQTAYNSYRHSQRTTFGERRKRGLVTQGSHRDAIFSGLSSPFYDPDSPEYMKFEYEDEVVEDGQ